MIKLLMLAIVAGLVFESQQQDVVLPGSGSASGSSCNYAEDAKCWTQWFDRGDPCDGTDSELISEIMTDYPGKMCSDPVDIQVVTLSGVPVSETGDFIETMDTTTGFSCSNDDQIGGVTCQDYRVRFSCYAPFCAPRVCWTDWFDRDNSCGSGDIETLAKLKEKHPGKICDKPLSIEVVTVDTLDPASDTGDVFHLFNPTEGFVCRNKDQTGTTCKDYQVRFGCPCKYMTTYW